MISRNKDIGSAEKLPTTFVGVFILKHKFELAIKEQQEILKRSQRKSNAIGYLKLGLFLLFVVSIYLTVTQQDKGTYKIVAWVLLAVQIVAWVYHSKIDDEVAHAQGIIEINVRHLNRVDGKWLTFEDTGEEFADPKHPYCNDLDVVGKKSLFQFINTTHTWHGRNAFANDLLYAKYEKHEIEERQAAIRELAADNKFTSELEYQFSKIGTDPSASALVEELQDDHPFMRSKVLRMLLMYGPLAILLFVGLVIVLHMQQFYLLSVCLYAVQALIWVAGSLSTSKCLKSINSLPFKLNAYSKVLEFVAGASFKAKRLQQLQTDLTISDVSAAQAIKELSKIANKASVRSNVILYFALNVLLLWDFECAFLFEDWKKKNAPHCEKWFLALGELESLSCFATLDNVCNRTCYPRMVAYPIIEAEEMGHPLIPNDVRVTNPLRLRNNIVIISGSNMSGKTTYLRTVGINIVLARAGGPVCAKEMTFSDLSVYTSMRIADDLNEGISTFYAELKRIKGILDAAKNDRTTLFLIDEIFRGTNSVDRLSGARTVITKLSKMGVSGMITTHDLELCDLQQTIPRIQNYSFSEFYKDGQILFDYKIRPGKSKTTNAKYLMELLEIL